MSPYLDAVAAGSYTCTVNFSGDASHAPSQSATFDLVIHPAATSLKVKSSLLSPLAGQQFTLSADIATVANNLIPRTGTVTLMEDGSMLQQLLVDASKGSEISLTLSESRAGTHKYSWLYSGDTNFKASGPVSIAIRVKNASKGSSSLPNAVHRSATKDYLLWQSILGQDQDVIA